MDFNRIWVLIKNNWQILLPACVLLVTTIWMVAILFHGGRIETLREEINLYKIKISFLEEKLKDIRELQLIIQNDPANASSIEEKISSLNYPSINNSNKLTKSDIEKLANFYNLTKNWKINPHLRMKTGDILYWCEHNPSEEKIKREFESRRLALEEAEKISGRLEQGELSYFARKIQKTFLR